MKHKIIGILICMLLLANISTVLGNTSEIPRRNIAGIGPNLAPNPSFEEGNTMPVGWTYDPNTTGIFHWDSNYAHSGEKSVGILNLTNIYPYEIMWITTDFIPVNETINSSYMLSVWFKFIDIPNYQYAWIRILGYDISYQPTGGSGHGEGSSDTEWHQISGDTWYDHGQTKYVKLEIGQAFNLPYKPNPLIEIRFDDVYFGIWNIAPNTPTITGETNGKVRTLYDYTISTIDPNQDNVTYEIDWGDNTTQTTAFYKSGEEIIIPHIWGIERTYSVRVKAIDEYRAESDWATLTVTMPCSYNKPIPQFLESLFQRFPHAFPILRQLLGY